MFWHRDAGFSEKPSDVCCAGGGGGVEGANQGALREKLCAGARERSAQVSVQQRTALSAHRSIQLQLQPLQRSRPGPSSAPASALPSAGLQPERRLPAPTVTAQRHLGLKQQKPVSFTRTTVATSPRPGPAGQIVIFLIKRIQP